MEIRCFITLVLSLGVASQAVIELTDVRFTDGNLLLGGTLEVKTTNGWERVCFGSFNSRMGDVVCKMLGFSEGAMSVRPAASLGISVNPLPSLGCQFNTVGGIEKVQCMYINTCDDHAVVTCNYPGYLGCYSHSRSQPALNDGMFANSNMTVQVCLTICRHRGYPYAGVAFGQECYCEAQAVDVSGKLGNEECYLPCVGNRLQICGGGTAVGIYDSRYGSCNSVFTDVEGAIVTPDFPGKYTHNEHCTWTVDVPNAANITVHVHSLELDDRDKLTIATSSMSEYVTFTGVPSSSSVHFETSGPGLTSGSALVFTFTGGRISVEFNSTMTSAGAQGAVLIYSAAIGEIVNTTEPQSSPTITMITKQLNVTVPPQPPTNTTESPQATVTVTTTSIFGLLTSAAKLTTTSGGTSQPTEASEATNEMSPAGDYTVTMTTDITVTDGGASSTTPRSISLESPAGTDMTPSIAVIVAISIGVVLIILLIVTAVVLFTTNYGGGRKPTRRHNPDATAMTNAAYVTSPGCDGQTDSGIYDPGYDTADAEPIYLSIRNDPRAEQLRRMDEKRESNRSYESVNRASATNREASVKTTKTDHDYQSVNGMSRKNTEKSYISIYPDSEQSIFNGGRVSPVRLPSEVSEDGYMIPTPKNSTQIKITKL